jgi:hypothetical protein
LGLRAIAVSELAEQHCVAMVLAPYVATAQGAVPVVAVTLTPKLAGKGPVQVTVTAVPDATVAAVVYAARGGRHTSLRRGVRLRVSIQARRSCLAEHSGPSLIHTQHASGSRPPGVLGAEHVTPAVSDSATTVRAALSLLDTQ